MSTSGQVNKEFPMISQKYITITQLAKACNTSRATLLRLEEAKLLEPVYVDESNGYRYYDSTSVFRVARILTYQDLGITRTELTEFYGSEDTQKLLLQSLEQKLDLMEDYVANLRIYLGQMPHLELSNYTFSEIYCYKEIFTGVSDPRQVRNLMWNTFDKVIYMGYPLYINQTPFISVSMSQFNKVKTSGGALDYTVYIPVLPEKNMENVVLLPRCQSVVSLLRGGSKDIIIAAENIMKYSKNNNLKLSDEIRILGVVTSYPGENIPMENWISRVCIPIIE